MGRFHLQNGPVILILYIYDVKPDGVQNVGSFSVRFVDESLWSIIKDMSLLNFGPKESITRIDATFTDHSYVCRGSSFEAKARLEILYTTGT